MPQTSSDSPPMVRTTWPLVYSISNSFLGQPNGTPLRNDLTQNQRSRLFREWRNRCLDCGAQGDSIRVYGSGLMERSKALNPVLAQMPNNQLRRDWQLRMRTFHVKNCCQRRGHKTRNGPADAPRTTTSSTSTLSPPRTLISTYWWEHLIPSHAASSNHDVPLHPQCTESILPPPPVHPPHTVPLVYPSHTAPLLSPAVLLATPRRATLRAPTPLEPPVILDGPATSCRARRRRRQQGFT